MKSSNKKGAISGKGIVGNMQGKPAAKAAFVKLGNVKVASNKSSKKR